ncbi:hypothetical protein PIB30_091732 [Stylosanthes scabra]|uniref:Uncharacterized protein n=1 Tax=Stylosanthes scabra TaxID=79078 RepID=A0ABU6ZTY7_9FABA|nr:hypothetical protein [Stylosanthes scabra]
MAASESTWLRITQSGSNTGQVTSNLRTLNKSARWETTHLDGSQRTFPLGQGKGQSLWTSDLSLS